MRVMNLVVLAVAAACFSAVSVAQGTEDSIDCIEACYEVEDRCIEECASADDVEQCEAACVAESERCQRACPEE